VVISWVRLFNLDLNVLGATFAHERALKCGHCGHCRQCGGIAIKVPNDFPHILPSFVLYDRESSSVVLSYFIGLVT
jgi:hypothetical protein